MTGTFRRRSLAAILVVACAPAVARSEDALRALSGKNRKARSLEELVGPVGADELAALAKREQSEPASFLFLNGTKTLGPEQAKEIAGSGAQVVVLNDLAALDAATAEALAKWPGHSLLLEGLGALGADTAKKLAAWPGKKLFLDGLPSLEPAAATELARFSGLLLSLRGARSMPPESAKALAGFKGFVAISLASGAKKSGIKKITRDELARISKAIVRGDAAAVKAFLEGGGDPDASEHGTTLLMEACYFKQLEVAKVLVAGGADVNARSDDHHTALQFAVEYPGFGGPEKNPAIDKALVKLLLDAQANPNPPKDAKPNRDAAWSFAPPLTRAAELGDLEVVEMLLKAGADVKGTDYRGYPALIGAINKGHNAVVKRLLEAGAVVNPENPPMGGIPLQQAITQRGSAIEMFVYDATEKKTEPDATKLAAMKKDAVELVDILVAAGAKLEATDDRGRTPLYDAINSGVVELAAALIDKGAKLDATDPKGDTPLHFLAGLGRISEKQCLPLAKLLVERKADRTAKNKDGLTPAEVAAKRGAKELAAALAP